MANWKNRKLLYILVLTTALVLALTSIALADNLIPDGDYATPVALNALALGDICAGESKSGDALFAINRVGGGQTFANSATVTVSVGTNSANATATMTEAAIVLPSDWVSLDNNTLSEDTATSQVTVDTTGLAIDSYSQVVKYQASGAKNGGSTVDRPGNLTVTWNVVGCGTDDTTAPELTLPDDQTFEGNTTGGYSGAYVGATATDDFDPSPSVVCTPASPNFFSLGTTPVNCTATDASGNSSSGSFNIIVVDTTAPTLVGMPADMTVEGNTVGGANVSFTDPTATDAVDPNPSVSCLPASGSKFVLGSTTVTCTATDASGNSSSGSFKITVKDTTAPVLTLPADQTYEGNTTGGYNGAYVGATATDVVDASPVVSCLPASGAFFALGSPHTVTCTATDASGNSSSGSFKITVKDTTAPVLTLPADQTFEGNMTGGYNGVFVGPTATDVVDASPVVVCTPASPHFFSLGDTTVNCTATDASSNSSSGSFKVTVVDTIPPVLTLPADQTFEGNMTGGYNGVFVGPTATDVVDASPVVVCTPASPHFFSLGDTTANCTATDASGNSSNGSFKITVKDTTAPVLTLPADQTYEGNTAGGYNGAYVGATATDIVDPAPTVACLPASGAFFALGGPHTITCTATDASGNSSNGSFKITVKDTTAPVLTLPANITTEATSGAGAVVSFSATATDIVDPAPVVLCDPSSGSTFLGLTIVTCTATDASGNQSSGSFTVYVHYNLFGFFAPVDNLPLLNSAKAGQAIPIKWRLTGANGIAISDPASFVSVSSSLGGLCGGSEDPVETYAGSSGLQYLGDGYWQFNWKTPKGYFGQCRTMTLTLSDGTTLDAYFKFK